jgi:hypothetical protein
MDSCPKKFIESQGIPRGQLSNLRAILAHSARASRRDLAVQIYPRWRKVWAFLKKQPAHLPQLKA